MTAYDPYAAYSQQGFDAYSYGGASYEGYGVEGYDAQSYGYEGYGEGGWGSSGYEASVADLSNQAAYGAYYGSTSFEAESAYEEFVAPRNVSWADEPDIPHGYVPVNGGGYTTCGLFWLSVVDVFGPPEFLSGLLGDFGGLGGLGGGGLSDLGGVGELTDMLSLLVSSGVLDGVGADDFSTSASLSFLASVDPFSWLGLLTNPAIIPYLFCGEVPDLPDFPDFPEPPPPTDTQFGFQVWRYDPNNGDLVNLNNGFDDLGPGNGNGLNRYPWGMEQHGPNNTLYVGTLNGNPLNFEVPIEYQILSLLFPILPWIPNLYTEGPEIWRWIDTRDSLTDGSEELGAQDGGYWEQVLAPEDLGGELKGQVGVRKMVSYTHQDDSNGEDVPNGDAFTASQANGVGDTYLYASTSNNLFPLILQNSTEPSVLLRSKTGDKGTWEIVNVPYSDDNNGSIRAMEVINGYLFVGTEKLLAVGPELVPELLFYDGHTWRHVDTSAVDGLAISEILGFELLPDLPQVEVSDDNFETAAVEVEGADTVFFGDWNAAGFADLLDEFDGDAADLGLIGDLLGDLLGESEPGWGLYMVEDHAAPIQTGSGDAFEVEALINPVAVDITPTHVTYVSTPFFGGPLPSYVTGEPDIDGKLDADDFQGDTSPFNDIGVMKLFEFTPKDEDPYMYVGTLDYFEGATLMRSQTPDDPTSWELITANGFLSELGFEAAFNPYVWSAGVVEEDGCDVLYIGTFNALDDSAGQVLRSTDGVNFEYLTSDAFGEGDIYGFRTMEVIDGELILGGASPITEADPNDAPYDFFS